MKILSLRLRDFRGYEALEFRPGEGTNLIHGKNGAGKTNLLEAVYALSLGQGFKGEEDTALIRYGAKGAYLEARIEEGGRRHRLSLYLGKDGKKGAIDGKAITRLSDLRGYLNTVLFLPSDVALFKGSPAARRAFLDLSIGKQYPDYLRGLNAYGKVLKDRNALLKAEDPDELAIATLTEELVALGEPLERRRKDYVAEMAIALGKIAAYLYGEKRKATLIYRPFVEEGDYREVALNYYRNSLASDREKGMTGDGLHREDFRVLLDGKDLATYGSQGENRLMAIALKLSPYPLVNEEEKKPVVLLDDVMAELDDRHRHRLMALLAKMKQAFITATNDIAGLTGTRFHIENHQIGGK